jgi:hypothetical protein
MVLARTPYRKEGTGEFVNIRPFLYYQEPHRAFKCDIILIGSTNWSFVMSTIKPVSSKMKARVKISVALM